MGHIQVLRDFPSPPEHATRTIRIYTPDAYDGAPSHRFPVLVMQDGQNVFEHPESAPRERWRVESALEDAVADGAIEPWLVVAVDHGPGRFEDYSAGYEPHVRSRGRIGVYAAFLREHLLPFVAVHYRVRPGPEWTSVAGSSLGGLAALWLGLQHPEVFGRVGALSPSVMWAHGAIFRAWQAHTRRWSRIYLDAGEHERFEAFGLTLDYGRSVRTFHEHLQRIGYGPHELRGVFEPGGQHSEVDWRRRLPAALRWLLA